MAWWLAPTNDKEPLAVPAQSRVDRTSPLVLAGTSAEHDAGSAVAAGTASYQVESSILIRLYGETTDKSTLKASRHAASHSQIVAPDRPE
jgi:hypothetical protein